MSDPVDVKTLGKLSEELMEAIQALVEFQDAYSTSQPLELEPINQALVNEFGDVLANMKLCNDRFSLAAPLVSESFTVSKISLDWHSSRSLISRLAAVGNIVARTIIQGLDGVDPTTGVINRRRLALEMAALYVVLLSFSTQFRLDLVAIDARCDKKKAYLRQVHAGA